MNLSINYYLFAYRHLIFNPSRLRREKLQLQGKAMRRIWLWVGFQVFFGKQIVRHLRGKRSSVTFSVESCERIDS